MHRYHLGMGTSNTMGGLVGAYEYVHVDAFTNVVVLSVVTP